MLGIWIAVPVRGVIAAIAALAIELVAAVCSRGLQPAVKDGRFRAPQRDPCPFQADELSSLQRSLRNRRAPMQRRSEMRFASSNSRLTYDRGAWPA